MKQITKKAIKEAPHYMVVIDWKADKRPLYKAFDYKLLDAVDVLAAMDEAETFFTDDVYMIYVLEKTSDTTDMGILYGSVLCSRQVGNYHKADAAHSEGGFWATYNPEWNFDPCCFHGAER